MKNLLIINASPREKGVCVEVANQIKPYFAECKVKQYDLYKLNPAPCNACGYCELHEGCRVNDLDIFFEDFEDADYIAVFSPMYNNFFPAPLKALLDRFQRYCALRYLKGANPAIEKHKSVGLVIASGSNARECANYMSNALKQSFAVMNGSLNARYYIPNTDSKSYTFNLIELEKFVHQMKKG